MPSLCEADILLWSEQQADLPRRLARGERVDDAVDWENLIEEAGDVGRGEFSPAVDPLTVGSTHLLMAHASPRPERVGHQRAETVLALADAGRRYAPSVGPRLDPAGARALAVAGARDELAADGGPAGRLPERCPFVVEDLVQRRPDLGALLARLADAGGPPAAR
jgi:hypothetical protein